MATWPWAKVSLGHGLHLPWLMHFHKPRFPHHHPLRPNTYPPFYNYSATFVRLSLLTAKSLSHATLFLLRSLCQVLSLRQSKNKHLSLALQSRVKYEGILSLSAEQTRKTSLSEFSAFLILFSPRVCLQNILWNWQVICTAFALQST